MVVKAIKGMTAVAIARTGRPTAILLMVISVEENPPNDS